MRGVPVSRRGMLGRELTRRSCAFLRTFAALARFLPDVPEPTDMLNLPAPENVCVRVLSNHR